ncbi:MAG: bifunctional UDP-N-acetylmuramoyl-tripeptide:D-alanyl-D-alanine ligase/alanine racemase [Saprospiraceae bacterium]|nr:bifunctional UDP-N-acetylmuramoyl-tripeptide:D-alanyl-D-alanine ligase/alanine racemase [Saprospiraceae bacterium]
MYSLSTIQKWLDAEWLLQNDAAQVIEHLAFDSRRIAFPEQTLFLALTAQRDGHDFITDAYLRGVRNFLVSKNIDTQAFSDANFLKTDDVLRGLQTLAKQHRAQFPHLTVIGITGSNGKTIVKEWLFELLRDDFNIVRSPASFNSQIGVPMSVWQIRPEHDLAIIEVGISGVGEMATLADIVKPTIGIFTNLGAAHDAGFSSRLEKLQEKFKLFDKAKYLIYNKNDVTETVATALIGTQKIAWSENEEADLFIKSKKVLTDGSTLVKAIFHKKNREVQLPFSDKAMLENAFSCWLTMLHLKIPPSVCALRLAHLAALSMRLDVRSGINGSVIVNDSYSNDLTSLPIALDVLVQKSRNLPRMVILSDLMQTAGDANAIYKQVAHLVVEKGVQKLIGIGDSIGLIQQFLPQNLDFRHFRTTAAFLSQIQNAEFQQAAILIKGARLFGFERIAARLSAKTHKTVLEVNLDALAHNLIVFRNLLRGINPHPVKLMAMVKASAYGSGSDEVAHLLEQRGIDYLTVAYADEGVTLRKAGIKSPIMVMNPEIASFDTMLRFDLEPEIYSLSVLTDFVQFVQNTEGEWRSKIHLKLDTGMHRLGFDAVDLPEVIRILTTHQYIKVASIFTHLAATDGPEHDSFTHLQVSRYQTMYATLTEGLGYKPMRHVLNSSGIVRFPEYHFDLVRLGRGMYGVASSEEMQQKLQVVQTLKATISQIKTIPKSETIGYSRKGILHRDSRIATISIGYADGLRRTASGGQFSVFLHGKLAPTVGNVCMDMTMIDVTDIPEAREGDDVEVFGPNVSIQTLADAIGTIAHEVFTSISERVKRVYFQE